MADADTNKKWLIGLTVTLIVFVIVSLAISISNSLKSASQASQLNKKMDTSMTEVNAKAMKQGPRGSPGRVGPKGDKGESGGVYLNQGRLKNQAQNLYVDRTANAGSISSVAYLNKNMNSTSQYWTHDNNGQNGYGSLRNKYGNNKACLTGNKQGNVYMDQCAETPGLDQQWMWDDIGNFRWAQDKSKCLSVKYMPLNSTSKVVNGQQVKNSGDSTAYKVILDKCSETNNARQIFVWR